MDKLTIQELMQIASTAAQTAVLYAKTSFPSGTFNVDGAASKLALEALKQVGKLLKEGAEEDSG